MGRHNLMIVRTAKAASCCFLMGSSQVSLPVVIGVLEYGEVRLFESMDQVMKEWGPYAADVVSEVIVFYDNDGVWLEPVFTRGFKLCRNTNPDASVDSVNLALFEATSLAPNPYFASLAELRARFPFDETKDGKKRTS